MQKKGILMCVAFCFALSLLMIPKVCSAGEMGDFDVDVAIGTTWPRHEWMPGMAYNPVENDFVVLWHTSGPFEEGGEVVYSLDGQRVSSDGDLVGGPIPVVPPFGGYCSLPRPVHNVFLNEYMVTFSLGDQYAGRDSYIAIVGGDGDILLPPTCVSDTETNTSHQFLAFNSQDREYLLSFNDYDEMGYSDNLGYILDEDGTVISDMFGIGTPAGDQFTPYPEYNPIDSTYLLSWEDFRHAPGPWWEGPNDIYGALLDADGNQIAEIPVIEDCGMPDEGTQWTPAIAHNSDTNEFLVLWGDTRPSLINSSAVLGRIILADGTPAGPDFIVADAALRQGNPEVVYVESMGQYFVVWTDCRNCDPDLPPRVYDNQDIYGKWLSASGEPVGDDIPICTLEGNQAYPAVAYSTVMERLLITWRDMSVDEPLEPAPPGPGHLRPSPGDVMGRVYGMASFCSGRVVEEGTGDPVEGASVKVLKKGPAQQTATNVGGWFNIVEDSQATGEYMLLVSKPGYKTVQVSLDYEGEPLTVVVEISKKSKKETM
jgi:hypothetical protein